jgi:hypothetical protein
MLSEAAHAAITRALDRLRAAEDEVGLYMAAQRWREARRALENLERSVEVVQIAMDEAGLPFAEDACPGCDRSPDACRCLISDQEALRREAAERTQETGR